MTSKSSRTCDTQESVLAQPQPGLDPAVWQDAGDGAKPVLTEEAREKLHAAVEWVQQRYNFSDLSVYVIGSICSN